MSSTTQPQDGAVRKSPIGDWQEFVNGRWYDWNDRPLCSCTVEDDGDGESGPHVSIVEWSPECERHPAEQNESVRQSTIRLLEEDNGYFEVWQDAKGKRVRIATEYVQYELRTQPGARASFHERIRRELERGS